MGLGLTSEQAQSLIDAGAAFAAMSGSGSAVFGLFERADAALEGLVEELSAPEVDADLRRHRPAASRVRAGGRGDVGDHAEERAVTHDCDHAGYRARLAVVGQALACLPAVETVAIVVNAVWKLMDFAALQAKGLVRGGALAVWRVLRCNPWSHGGFDPAPPRTVR